MKKEQELCIPSNQIADLLWKKISIVNVIYTSNRIRFAPVGFFSELRSWVSYSFIATSDLSAGWWTFVSICLLITFTTLFKFIVRSRSGIAKDVDYLDPNHSSHTSDEDDNSEDEFND